jgi:competence protein ComEC
VSHLYWHRGEGPSYSKLIAHFIYVGQGDSIFIEMPGGASILIDGGPRSAGSKVVSYLKNLGINKINIVIGTHPHEDHIGGLIEVLNNFEVDNLIDSGVAHTTKTYQEYLDTVLSKDINYIVPEPGEVFDLQSGISMKIQGPIAPTLCANISETLPYK